MPIIRLAEIPNAMPRSVGASGANIGVPRLGGGLVVNPRVAQLDGATAMSSESATRAANNMIAQKLSLNAFTAEAEAGMRLGRAIGGVGDVMAEWGMRFARAKDTADIARAETVMRAAFEKQQNDQLDLPADKWQDNWQKNIETARKALSEIEVSENAAKQLVPSFERWSELSSLQIQNQQRQKQIRGFQMDVDANAMMKVADGDLVGALSIYDKAAKDGIYTPEESKLRQTRIHDDIIRKAKEDNINRLTSELNADPWAMRPLFERRSQGEEVPELGELSPVQATGFLTNADSLIRRKVADQDDDADQLILTGQIKTAKELREKYPMLPERRLLQHENTMKQVFDASPEAWNKVVAARPRLLSAIELYDPASDDQDMTKYFEVKDAIKASMPQGERQEMLEMLATKRKEGNKMPEASRNAIATINKLADMGFGTDGPIDAKKLNSKNEAVRAAESRRLLDSGAWQTQKLNEFQDWAKKNPTEARNPNSVREYLQHSMSGDAIDKAIGIFDRERQASSERKETERAAKDVLDMGQTRLTPPGQFNFGSIGNYRVTEQTRDELQEQSTVGARQVSLDFNSSDSGKASGVEVVIPYDATTEERAAAEAYTNELTDWFASKGVNVPNRGVLDKTGGTGQKVSRFHTEPFFIQDAAARQAIIEDAEQAAKRGEPSEYAELLARTLGSLEGVTLLAPHKSTDGGTNYAGHNERDFARKYIIPSLKLIQKREEKLAKK